MGIITNRASETFYGNAPLPANNTNITQTTLSVPSITSFTPIVGPVGTFVTIKGTGFTGVTFVKFTNNAVAAFNVQSCNTLHATVPPAAFSGKIKVTTAAGGDAVSAQSFTVIPAITSFTPASGNGGTVVTIYGTTFTKAQAMKFNGVNDQQIRATAPSTVTTGKISATGQPGTGTGYSAADFVVPPKITSFSPTSGRAGTSVKITGSG